MMKAPGHRGFLVLKKKDCLSLNTNKSEKQYEKRIAAI